MTLAIWMVMIGFIADTISKYCQRQTSRSEEFVYKQEELEELFTVFGFAKCTQCKIQQAPLELLQDFTSLCDHSSCNSHLVFTILPSSSEVCTPA